MYAVYVLYFFFFRKLTLKYLLYLLFSDDVALYGAREHIEFKFFLYFFFLVLHRNQLLSLLSALKWCVYFSGP